mgnify:CR=1 FL=1
MSELTLVWYCQYLWPPPRSDLNLPCCWIIFDWNIVEILWNCIWIRVWCHFHILWFFSVSFRSCEFLQAPFSSFFFCKSSFFLNSFIGSIGIASNYNCRYFGNGITRLHLASWRLVVGFAMANSSSPSGLSSHKSELMMAVRSSAFLSYSRELTSLSSFWMSLSVRPMARSCASEAIFSLFSGVGVLVVNS